MNSEEGVLSINRCFKQLRNRLIILFCENMEREENSERGGAEAVLNLQQGSSISLSYHPFFGTHEDIMLLELDEKLLQEVLHQRVVIRGQADEEAVLCSQSKTYGMKFVGTSNSVLLVPPSDQPGYPKTGVASAIKAAPGFMELVEVAPRLDKLKTLLFENPYRSDEEEMEGSEKGLYKWDDLTSSVQASDEELRSGLEALSALEINGHWRVVDEKYMDVMLRILINNSVLNDWSLGSLDQYRVVEALCSDGFPPKLAEHCLRVFGVTVGEGTEESGPVWKLEEKRVCVHFARQILRGGKVRMESLVEEMDKKTPECMRASFEMLEGEVLTEQFGDDTWVRGFSVSSLPSTPPERFSALFNERQKWEWKDLEPYVRDLTVPGLSLEGLLLKYTRRTQPNADAEPIFSSR